MRSLACLLLCHPFLHTQTHTPAAAFSESNLHTHAPHVRCGRRRTRAHALHKYQRQTWPGQPDHSNRQSTIFTGGVRPTRVRFSGPATCRRFGMPGMWRWSTLGLASTGTCVLVVGEKGEAMDERPTRLADDFGLTLSLGFLHKGDVHDVYPRFTLMQ